MAMTATITVAVTPMSTDAGAALYRLMTWLSPAYPVGAFSHSTGLEWAVRDGTVSDASTCRGWLEDVLRHGTGWQDAVILAAAWRAAASGDASALGEIEELALALNPCRERRIETVSQGSAFHRATMDAWPLPAGMKLSDETPYPVAVAMAAATHGVPLAAVLQAYLHAISSNVVSAAIRLVPLGQTDGQRIIAALEATVGALAEQAETSTLDDLGAFSFRADIASMQHEEQHVRLFRT